MRISPGRVTAGGHIKQKLNFKKSQKCQKICLQKLNKNGFKTRFWDDSGAILYVYNILGYREKLSEKTGKSQTILNNNIVSIVLKTTDVLNSF